MKNKKPFCNSSTASPGKRLRAHVTDQSRIHTENPRELHCRHGPTRWEVHTTRQAVTNWAAFMSKGPALSICASVATMRTARTSATAPFDFTTAAVIGTHRLGGRARDISRCLRISESCPRVTAASAWKIRAVSVELGAPVGSSSMTTDWHAPRKNAPLTRKSSSPMACGTVGMCFRATACASLLWCFHCCSCKEEGQLHHMHSCKHGGHMPRKTVQENPVSMRQHHVSKKSNMVTPAGTVQAGAHSILRILPDLLTLQEPPFSLQLESKHS